MRKKTTHVRALFRELKRRKVAKTCLLYVVLCWGALGVFDVVLPTLEMDANHALQNLIIAAIAGLPLALTFSWFYQVTPRGIVRTTPFVDRRVLDNISPINDKRKDKVATFFGDDDEGKIDQWVITAEAGVLAGLSYGISEPITLGRSTDCDITLPGSEVSRQHARLYVEDGLLIIKDLGSSNGSLVNGEELKGIQILRHDDEVVMHDHAFKVFENYAWIGGEASACQTTYVKRNKS